MVYTACGGCRRPCSLPVSTWPLGRRTCGEAGGGGVVLTFSERFSRACRGTPGLPGARGHRVAAGEHRRLGGRAACQPAGRARADPAVGPHGRRRRGG
eukprot:349892-Chlamydomonas_euryale.AAC.4